MGRQQLDEAAGLDQWHLAAQILLSGQLTDYHRRFVASMTSRAVLTVLHELVAQKVMLSNPEAEALKEGWDACKEADTSDTTFFRLSEERFDEQAPCSLASDTWANNYRAKFGKMRPINVKSNAADQPFCGRLNDGKRVDVPAYFCIRAMEQGSVVRMIIHQAADGIGILQSSSARSHGQGFSSRNRVLAQAVPRG